jgi:hypothetical protein
MEIKALSLQVLLMLGLARGNIEDFLIVMKCVAD